MHIHDYNLYQWDVHGSITCDCELEPGLCLWLEYGNLIIAGELNILSKIMWSENWKAWSDHEGTSLISVQRTMNK